MSDHGVHCEDLLAQARLEASQARAEAEGYASRLLAAEANLPDPDDDAQVRLVADMIGLFGCDDPEHTARSLLDALRSHEWSA